VLIRLHTFYPQARGAFTGYEVKRYSADAGTGGAYLAYGPGQISKYWRLWERPVQRIAFAGEHTDALYPGTLEGALRSGQRAAGQVQDLLAGKSFDPVKAVPAAATAAAGAAAAKSKGNFFTNLFGGASNKDKAGDQAPAKPEAQSTDATGQKKPGFFARLFGAKETPAPEPQPAAKAADVAPVAPPVAQPAAQAPQQAPASPAPAVKAAPTKAAATKAAPVKQAPAHKPAAKSAHKPAHKPADSKKAATKPAPAKKPLTDSQAKAS